MLDSCFECFRPIVGKAVGSLERPMHQNCQDELILKCRIGISETKGFRLARYAVGLKSQEKATFRDHQLLQDAICVSCSEPIFKGSFVTNIRAPTCDWCKPARVNLDLLSHPGASMFRSRCDSCHKFSMSVVRGELECGNPECFSYSSKGSYSLAYKETSSAMEGSPTTSQSPRALVQRDWAGGVVKPESMTSQAKGVEMGAAETKAGK